MHQDRIVAIGLLTDQDLSLLGPTFSRAWPLEDTNAFKDLLRAIDEAEARRDAKRPTEPHVG